MKCLILLTICISVSGGVVLADWQPGQSAKWVQLPDLEPSGIDVMSTNPKVLADDFLCTSTGPVTDIHIWGSWYRDILPVDDAGNPDAGLVSFTLSIHRNIPDPDPDNPETWSKPGELLWERTFQPDQFEANLFADNIEEGWYNPNTQEYEPVGDHQAWQYNFLINPSDAFQQQGTPSNPVVYWLDVQAMPAREPGTVEPLFGWKTSVDHWNDDAAWADTSTSPSLRWQELRYPSSHPYAGKSIDMAFVITPEPMTFALLAAGGIALTRKRRR